MNLLDHFESLYLVLDAAQFFGHGINLNSLLDSLHPRLLLFGSGHKYLLGPEGAAFLLVHKNSPIKPLLSGGTGADSRARVMPEELPYRLEPGSYSAASIAGLTAAISRGQKYYQALSEQKTIHTQRLQEALQELQGYTLLNRIVDFTRHTHAITLVHREFSPSELSYQLFHGYKIISRHGYFCAPLLFKSFPENFSGGALRISMGYSNTDDDVDTLIKALSEIH